jgi:uncharacterized membrane protein
MKFINPFQLNDWNIKIFLTLIILIQIILGIIIALSYIGFNLPIIQQLIGFIYLTFIPGLLILRILNLHKLNGIETILYSVGLSLATLMITGFLINLLYPILGFSKPISQIPLFISISLIITVFCVICFFKNRSFSASRIIDINKIFNPFTFFLFILPFLSIFGTFLINNHNKSILIMILFIIISILVIYICFNKKIPEELYPLIIFFITISLLYSTSLFSEYIWGWDIHKELYFSNLVINNSVWDRTIYSNLNAMLSITILAPIYSIISNINIIWIFKLIYPLLFSLVPLGLYSIFKKQTNTKIAFLSVFFFISIFTFFREMMQLARQQIAEIFLVLLILLIIDTKINNIKKSFLFVIFGISLVVSHYGLSYIFMFSIIFVWIILNIIKRQFMQNIINKIYLKLKIKYYVFQERKKIIINSNLILLFILFNFTWYVYIADSSAFDSIIHYGNQVTINILDILNPETSQALGVITGKTSSFLHVFYKGLHLLAQFLIIIGILTIFFQGKLMNFFKEYKFFSYVSFIFLLAGIFMPYFSSSLGVSRLYHILLFFLAPFCIIGGITTFKIIIKLLRIKKIKNFETTTIKILSIFFGLFLLFNTGFIDEVMDDRPTSFVLNSSLDYPDFNKKEVIGAIWLNNVREDNHIYADEYGKCLLKGYMWFLPKNITMNEESIKRNSNIYFRSYNIEKKSILISITNNTVQNKLGYISIEKFINKKCKIYTNNGSEIYFH